jgi:two-component system, cell cycle sensor histidine kinase and response regulator CckA
MNPVNIEAKPAASPKAKTKVPAANRQVTEPAKTTALPPVPSRAQLASGFRKVERREWWLWATAITVTLLLAVGLSSFILPRNWNPHEEFYGLPLAQAVRGLIGLVLVFDCYTVYQQLQIHRIRRRLSEREELFRLISDNAADMIAVVDMNGRRIYNSMAYQKVLRYSPEELKGSSSLEQVHPLDRHHVKMAADHARMTGIGVSLEYRIRHKDGSWRIFESTSSVIKDAKGVPDKLVIVNRDVTERKAASEALRQSEASIRAVIENAPYGIYLANSNGKMLRVNPALQKMLGYSSADELLKKNLAMDLLCDQWEHERIFEMIAQKKQFKDLEIDWKRKDGGVTVLRCSGLLVKGPGDEGACVEAFAEDVTEKRSLERQLQVAQKMEAIGRLSGGIAHDFNNLLGVIIGYSQVLKKRLDANDPLRDHAEEIDKAGQRAAALTRQLLAFSRQQVLTPAILSLNTLLSDMGKMLPRMIGEDIELVLRLEPSLGSVKADQSQIEQVVMNLAVNARDAMPRGGKLIVETANVNLDEAFAKGHPGARTGQFVVLGVTDTGCGMNSKTMAHIFEPFFTTKEPGKGTGLGLATVYGVVKQSGGYIWVDSEPGKGSSFRVYLPQAQVERIEESPAALPAEALHGDETVLLVEDAGALRKLTHSLLEQNGYRVFTAESGVEALKILEKVHEPIHLLLTDVVMPGMNGRALAEHLVLERPGLKVLYMSGYTQSAVAEHGVLEPGTHLLHKPFTEESLLRKVREVLNAAPPQFVSSQAVPEGSETVQTG